MNDLNSLSLTKEELEFINSKLSREPNFVELSILDAQYSEHCSYKSSKKYLKLIPSKGKRVLFGPGYEAGVLDVDNNQVITIHIESHNHPSAIDPYGGAATGVGGVLRDILSMGTRPIAVLDSLRFGNIEKSSNSRWLLKNVVRGIADYGNCVGIPTVGGEVAFDESYERNCLVDVVSIGLGKKKDLVFAEARDSDDAIILVGGLTGRDGIHGSAFASKDLGPDSNSERSAVQIPDPFTKKLILESTFEVISTGFVKGLKDCGGGGLACALSEIAANGGTGLDIDLSKIPLRENDMEPYEIMISESQERMVFIIENGKESEIINIFNKYNLSSSVIGRVTKSHNLLVYEKDVTVANLPVDLIVNPPLQLWNSNRPKYLDAVDSARKPNAPQNIENVLLEILSSPNISNKKWIYEQYDHEVGLKTVVKPGAAGSSVLRISDNKFIAISVDGNPSHCFLDPYNGMLGVLAESSRNLVAVGSEPIGMVDHLQFGKPNDPEVFYTFSESINALVDYCKYFDLPCVGGKVSFYNEDSESHRAIKPTPVISSLGLIKGENKIKTRALDKQHPLIVMVGKTSCELGGSEYYKYVQNFEGGKTPIVNLETERNAQKLVIDAIKVGIVNAVDDCSKGGLFVTIAKMCATGNNGATIELNQINSDGLRWDELLFSESHSRFVLSTDELGYKKLLNIARNYNVPIGIIGEVTNDRFIINNNSEVIFDVGVNSIQNKLDEKIPLLMGNIS